MVVTVKQGHVIDVLAGMEAGSVHTVCTSPPYWMLRAYGTPPQVWQSPDGDALCAPGQHEWTDASWRDSRKNDDTAGVKQRTSEGSVSWRNTVKEQAFCARCGAWRGELGQEPTPDCGAHGMPSDGDLLELRDDLTPDEVAFVLSELGRLGVVR